MTIQTPDWVRDAVFYQVFPDRFASSARVPQAGTARAVGPAADRPRLQGRRPRRDRRAAAVPRGPRRHRALPDADLRVRLEPPVPHLRLPRGRSAPRRRRRAARAARRRTRTRACGWSSTACSTTRAAGSGRSTTCWRTAPPRRTGTGSTSSTDALEGRRAFRPYPWAADGGRRPDEPGLGIDGRPARRPVGPPPRLPRVVGAARRCPSSTPSNPAVREHIFERRRALAPLRHRRLAPRRAHGDPRRGVLAGVPPSLPRGQPGRVHRRRDLARGPRVARGRPLRRGHELPARRGDPGLRGAGSPQRAGGPRVTTSTATPSSGATARRSARSWSASWASTTVP